MYLWDSGACTYSSGRTRSFIVCIVLVYAKGLHLCSGPLCHDALHSICHIKIKLHLTYSALSQRKSLSIILTISHLISLVFYHSSHSLPIHQIIFILHSCISASSYAVNQPSLAFCPFPPWSDLFLTIFDQIQPFLMISLMLCHLSIILGMHAQFWVIPSPNGLISALGAFQAAYCLFRV